MQHLYDVLWEQLPSAFFKLCIILHNLLLRYAVCLSFRKRYACNSNTLSIKIAQRPHIIGSLGPKALKYESLEGKGH